MTTRLFFAESGPLEISIIAIKIRTNFTFFSIFIALPSLGFRYTCLTYTWFLSQVIAEIIRF